MPALRFAAILAWVVARLMLLGFYMGAFAIAGSLALQRIGYESDLVIVYLPALLAMPLFLCGGHYLFGPELRREAAKSASTRREIGGRERRA